MSRPSAERSEYLRDEYYARIGQNYRPEHLVSVDEAGCNRSTTRQYGWALFGEHASRHDVTIRLCAANGVCHHSILSTMLISIRYSVLPVISLDGVLHIDIRASSYNGPLSLNIIQGLLDNMNPFTRLS